MIKPQSLALLAGAAALACAVSAHASILTFTTTLSGANEMPANLSTATGSALVTLDDTLSTLRVQTSFAGLSSGVTLAHIHCCTAVAGVGNVAVATPMPAFAGFPLGDSTGTFDGTFDMTMASSWSADFITAHGGTTASAFSDLVAGVSAGEAYVNLHTAGFPGGEVRGFLVSAVPEPSSVALLLAGLGAVGYAARRRARG